MLQQKETILPLDREAWLEERGEEIRKRLTWLILIGELDWKDFKGRVIDLGTGSGAGVVALEALRATQVVGVEDGRGLRAVIEEIANPYPINPHEAFPPVETLRQQGKIIDMSNEEYLKLVKKQGWEISLITCFWIDREPPMKQIEEVLIPGGKVVITADEKSYSVLNEIAEKTSLETEVIRIPGEVVDRPVNDDLVLIGEKLPQNCQRVEGPTVVVNFQV